MTQTAAKQQLEGASQRFAGEPSLPDVPMEDLRELQAARFRLLWDRRRSVVRAIVVGLLSSTLVAFLLPKSYTSTTQLMPPDSESTSAMAMMAGLTAKAGGGLGAMAGDVLGMKSSGALFVGVLKSQTAQDRLVQQFDLQKVYGFAGRKTLLVDARTKLDDRTSISEDRKSGIISISVTDRDPKRAAALANAYVDQLNSLVAELSTSSAHRERVFLEGRLKFVKRDLDDASNQLAQFSSKNNTLDIEQEGKAMLDAAGTIAGQLIAAQSQLEGLRQIYTDNNARVREMNARVAELRRQLEKLGGTQANGGKGRPVLSSTNSQSADPPSSQKASLPSNHVADSPSAQTSDPLAEPAAEQATPQSGAMPYPTIRSLPLLGARYSDYYRRAKIQETVFELLTQQYELAKVQEAKETPSVKTLDPATIPERKSFPPRLLITFLGTAIAISLSVVWVLGSNQWQKTDPGDPRKILAQEAVAAMLAIVPWRTRNGNNAVANDSGVSGRSDDRAEASKVPQ